MNSNLGYSPETRNSGLNLGLFVPCYIEIWRMTSKINRAPILCPRKLCALFRSHVWTQIAVTVRKRRNWGKICLFCDLGLWPLILFFAWTSLVRVVITPENFKMIRWQEYRKKGVAVGRKNGQRYRGVVRVAWAQLKIYICILLNPP